jgi:hypothetical protein
MKAEFLKDENGNIWFSNAKEIHTRDFQDSGLEIDNVITDEKMAIIRQN